MRDLDDRVFRFACRAVDLFEMLHARGGAATRKESRESLYWLKLIAAQRLLDPAIVLNDISEARQLTAILRAIIVKSRMSDRRG